MSVPNMIKTLTTTILNLVKTRANGDLSNLTDLGEEKLRLSSSVSGFYVGDIGIAIGGIDESKGARKYLNGQKFSLNDYPDFKNWLEERKKACPSAFVNTEAEWNAIQAKSDHAQCGKFYYNKEANTVKLPRIVIVQGTTDMSTVGTIKEEGLPNITGIAGMSWCSGTKGNSHLGSKQVTGCFYSIPNPTQKEYYGINDGSCSDNDPGMGFDAHRSNPIYGNSTTVQPESIQYPYFIQVKVSAEAVTHNVNELDLDLNNPFSLFDVRWSSHRIDNLSWLVSNGQYNEGNSYPTAYEYLVNKYNTGVDEIDTITYVSKTDVTKKETISISYRTASNGMKITKDLTTYQKLVENTGTAWYFVLDPTLPGFYLPQTDGCLQGGTYGTLGQFTPQGLPNITGYFDGHGATGSIYKTGCFTQGATVSGSKGSGNGFLIDFDASRSNTVYGNSTKVQPNGVKGLLYFYVGEYIQGANLINLETMKAQLTSELTSIMQTTLEHRIVESYCNGESWYRVYADGWCEQGGATPEVTANASGAQTVTLLKDFIDTNYQVQSTGRGTNVRGYSSSFEIISNSQFTLRSGYCTNEGVSTNITKGTSLVWRAYGYIK